MAQLTLTCQEKTYRIPVGTSLEQALTLLEPMFPQPIMAIVDNIPRAVSYTHLERYRFDFRRLFCLVESGHRQSRPQK